LAKGLLGWQAARDLAAMCADTWRWQSVNPLGFDS
jgi:UDP-glucose 4-epimerase